MKKIIFLLILISFVSLANPAYAYWIWSPKTGIWTNPKYVVKPTPQEQLKFAQSFFEKKDFERALIEFRALIKNYPKAFEAAQAQFSSGTCLENMDKLYEAYLAYQKMIDKYPFSDKINEAIQKEFDIADKFINGKKRKFVGVPLPVENPAIEILRKVIDNSTYGPLAPIAQYKLGLLFKAFARYQEAQEEFEKVIANYPESEWAEPAKFQIAVALAKVSPSGKYDETTSLEAKKRFEEFVRTHPDAELSEDALQEIDRISEKQAENNFNIARFYEKQHAWEAAKIYYNTVIKDFSRSKFAPLALERVKVVEKMFEITKKKTPLTKEEKQALREKKKQEKEERIEEAKTDKESRIGKKKEALENKKSGEVVKRQEKLEDARKLKEEKQAKKETKIQFLKEERRTKQKTKAEILEKKKSEAQAKKQARLETIEKKKDKELEKRKVKLELLEKKKQDKKTLQEKKLKTNKNIAKELEKQEKEKVKQELLEKKKADKEAKLKAKIEKAQQIKLEKKAKKEAKIQAVKDRKAKKGIFNQKIQNQEAPKSTTEPSVQEAQVEITSPETKEVTVTSGVQQKESTPNNDSGPQIETRPGSEEMQ